MGKPNKVTAQIRRHWGRVADLGCLITGQPAEICHVHGGSITEVLGPKFRPGWSQKQNHWLVIPLSPVLHRVAGYALDVDVAGFESMFGPQIELLEEVSWRLGYNVFSLAGASDYVYQTRDQPHSCLAE